MGYIPSPIISESCEMGNQQKEGIKGSQSLTHFPGTAEVRVKPGREVGGEPCLRLWLIPGTSFSPGGRKP